jgi:hypothetical protein
MLDYQCTGRHKYLTTTAVIAVTGGGIAFFNLAFTSCICGHQDWLSLPGNLVGLGIVTWSLLRHGGWGHRVLAGLMAVFCLLILAGNAHNILWSGHNPLLL